MKELRVINDRGLLIKEHEKLAEHVRKKLDPIYYWLRKKGVTPRDAAQLIRDGADWVWLLDE